MLVRAPRPASILVDWSWVEMKLRDHNTHLNLDANRSWLFPPKRDPAGMRKTRDAAERIVGLLRQAEEELAQGRTVGQGSLSVPVGQCHHRSTVRDTLRATGAT
jgi:hypothetical protein